MSMVAIERNVSVDDKTTKNSPAPSSKFHREAAACVEGILAVSSSYSPPSSAVLQEQ